MKRLIRLLIFLIILGGAYAAYWYTSRPPTSLLLTGIVTSNHVVVSPQITGRLEKLTVAEGDTVKAGQLVAVLAPDELREERAFFTYSAEGVGSQVQENEAAVRLQERLTTDQIAQAEANLEATRSQEAAAQAEFENAKIAYERAQRMMKDAIGTQERLDEARTAYEVGKSKLAALAKQIDALRAAVALAKSQAEQVTIRQNQLQTNRKQQAAATAQQAKADVRLAYTQ